MNSLPATTSPPLRVSGLCVSLICFVVYMTTLAPTVGFIDSGELSAVAYTLGIAHPTGYPLFTLVGWLFARIPIGGDEIVRLNAMAAFISAMAVYLFFRLTALLLWITDGRSREDSWERLATPAAGAALLLAFSETVWMNAVSVEVYSVHLFFIVLLLLLFTRALLPDLRSGSGAGDDRPWYLFAFALGLSFTNHMTTVLLAPGLLYLYFAVYGFHEEPFRRLIRMSVPFLMGLTPYLYLPVRGSQGPLFSWGDPTNLERFLWHLRGKQYSVWIFSSSETAGRQFSYFLSTLPDEMTIVGLAGAFVGSVLLIRRNRKIGITVALLFVFCLLYAVNYDIHDIDSYFLLAYVAMAIWGAISFSFLFDWLKKRTAMRVIPLLVIPALGVPPLVTHFSERDESRNYLVEDYTRNMFASFDSNAVVFSFQWDYWVSASYYYQYVKGVRPDVAVIDKELLRRSWYLKELRRRYPWLMEGSKKEVGLFEKELSRFEHGLPYEGPLIQSRFVGMIQSMIIESMVDRPVYVTGEIEPEFTQGLQRIPAGLAYRLSEGAEFVPTAPPEFEFRPFGRQGRLEDQVLSLYAEAWAARGAYYYMQGSDPIEAGRSVERALRLDPASRAALFWRERMKTATTPSRGPAD